MAWTRACWRSPGRCLPTSSTGRVGIASSATAGASSSPASALRHLLGSYLDIDPGSVPLVAGPHGKPRLAQHASSRLCFNTSRSEDLAVFAVAHDRELGVDVERALEDVDLEPLTRRILCAAELRAFGRLEPEARRGAFYRSWTRKEACLKALGVGLTVAPNQLDVTGDSCDATDSRARRRPADAGNRVVAARCRRRSRLCRHPRRGRRPVETPDDARTHRSVRRSGPRRLHLVTGRAT